MKNYLSNCQGSVLRKRRCACAKPFLKTIQQGGKNFAALPGSGKQEDEQEALLDVISGVLMGKWGSAGTILLKHILKDYFDQTIPDAAYYSGWIQKIYRKSKNEKK